MKDRFRIQFGLRMKFICFFFLLGAVVLCVILFSVFESFQASYAESYRKSLLDVAEIMQSTIMPTPEAIRGYAKSGQIDEPYERMLEKLKKVQEHCDLESLYVIYWTGEGVPVYFADASRDNPETLGSPVLNFESMDWAVFREVFEEQTSNTKLDVGKGSSGNIISVYYPIMDEDGREIAVIGVDKKMDSLTKDIMSRLSEAAGYMIVLIAAEVAALILFVQISILSAIGRLKQAAGRIADGKPGVQMRSRRRDEIGDIIQVFNRMSVSIEGHMAEMEELNGAYRKFVPGEMFGILDRKSIVEIRRGDQAKINPTILFMEPKGAKRRLSGLSSEQMFRYINEMHEKTVSAAIGQGGAVWNFENAGVCCFFQYDAKGALDAALEACRNLKKKGEELAAGITRGTVMVGIAGHEKRMELVSISEQTKTAAFLMHAGERYQASVLIGKSAAAQIPDFASSYHTRFLGYIRLEAEERIEGVYDVYDGDSDEDRKLKQRTKEIFERGVASFTGQQYKNAREAFIDVLRLYRRDGAAKEYLYLCNRALEEKNFGGRVWFAELKKENA